MRGAASPSIEIQAEFFPVETTKARWSVAYFTLSIDGAPDDAQQFEIDEVVHGQGGSTQWRVNATFGRSYAAIEAAETADLSALRSVPDAVLYEGAVIALAVSPSVPQALPKLIDAIDGPGKPAGILACRRYGDGVIVEWDSQVTRPELVFGAIDVELRRFESGRSATLLSPLPKSVVTSIAAQGLAAPQIGNDRILELLMGHV
jgi:hypothetical protein